MARNENVAHPNGHTFYLSMTGGGKSTALKANPDIPKRGGRALIYDPDLDHWALHTHTLADFLRHVRAAARSGKPYRIAYTGRQDDQKETVDNFERFCKIVWAVLDGTPGKEVDVIIEELADVSPGAGRATVEFGRLLRRSRKYGCRLHMTSQRPQEIAKTALSQAGKLFVGTQQTSADRKHLAAMIDVPETELATLQPLEFFIKSGAAPAQRIDFKKFVQPIKVAPAQTDPPTD